MSYSDESVFSACDRLSALWDFEGEPAAFWKEYLEQLGHLAAAEWVLLISRTSEDVPWGMHMGLQPGIETPAGTLPPENVRAVIPEVAAAALNSSKGTVKVLEENAVLCIRLKSPGDEQELLAVFLLRDTDEASARDRMLCIALAADRAIAFQMRRTQESGESDREAYVRILDIVAALYGQERYQAACISLCNELAGRFDSDQVSLGFLADEKYIRLQSISRTAHFDRKMDVVVALEKAMEEAADQDQEVVYPVPEGSFLVARVHEQLARKHGAGALLTVPLRGEEEKIEGGVTLQRAEGAFSENEIRQIAMAVQLAAPRLLELKLTDRWFPVRWAKRLRKSLGRLIGYDHTFAKVAALLVTCLLVALIFGQATYRVEAPFIVKADRMTHLTAPFDGFVQESAINVGDIVEAEKVMLILDRAELLLEKSAAQADLLRYTREAEKNQAEQRLADMQISSALALQAQARLDQIDYRLEQSLIRAPFKGVVVEGQWQDKLNAPVRPGELLVKLAQLDSLYLQLDISESDIFEVSSEFSGQFAFLTAPEVKYDMSLDRIHPAAVDREDGVVFEARATMQSDPAEWWRPGMTGVAKIDIGRRSLWWIFTHKTTDYLRRKLWW